MIFFSNFLYSNSFDPSFSGDFGMADFDSMTNFENFWN